MGRKGGLNRTLRAALAAALALAAVVPLSACAASSSSYAGIPLGAGSPDPSLQELARRARRGDKRAQFELGQTFEQGRGVAPDLKRARRLYRYAATRTGGVRLAYVPAVGGKGRGATVPINAGKLVPGLPEAAARLAALQGAKAAASGPVQADRRFFPASATGLGSGPLDEVLSTLLRIEMASDSCFPLSPETESEDSYSDRVWRCVLQTRLPEDCTRASDAVLRTARFIRFNPSFTLLQRSANGLVERCAANGRRSMNDVYATRRQANFLDLALLTLRHATERQDWLADKFSRSYASHGPSHAPILQFAETMCRRLVAGNLAEPASFWLLFCNSGNLYFTERVDRSRLIDETITGKGVYDWGN